MITRVAKWFKIAAVTMAMGIVALGVVAPTDAHASTPTGGAAGTAPGAKSPSDCETGFLTFPAWFRGIVKVDDNNNCQLMSPTDTPPGGSGQIGISNYVWRIVLNVIEIALHLIGYLAVFFIIYGGFRFLTRGDNPSEVEAARKTIMNAVIGLVISIASIALVGFIFRIFG